MEPVSKKAKITGHFRVALKPQDVNAQRTFKKLKTQQDNGKENIEVITISDDEDENNPKRQQTQTQIKVCDTEIKVLLQSQQQHQNQHQQNSQPQPQLSQQKAQLSQLHAKHHQQQPKQLSQQLVEPEKESKAQLKERQNCSHNKYFSPPGILPEIVDLDRNLLEDIRCEPHYAWDSFQYDRQQELQFKTSDYLYDADLEQEITPLIRAELVDWLVQLQNLFELDHEPLYMAVKMADQYLMRKFVPRDNLGLLYLTTLLISAKFDERLPPVQISELLRQNRLKFGTRYSRRQVIALEVDILTTLSFNIRFPLSYGFLRRFAHCTRSDKKTLYLARYILESSLLEYEMIEELESKIAAGSLLLAFEMLNRENAWTESARFYTGYEEEELVPLQIRLNEMISRRSMKKSSIRRKYSHEFFMEVARIEVAPPKSKLCAAP